MAIDIGRMSMSADEKSTGAPMDERHLSALEFIKSTYGFRTNTDALRRAVIMFAKSIGWKDPQEISAKATGR